MDLVHAGLTLIEGFAGGGPLNGSLDPFHQMLGCSHVTLPRVRPLRFAKLRPWKDYRTRVSVFGTCGRVQVSV